MIIDFRNFIHNLYLQSQRRSSTSSIGLPNPKITITLAPNVDQSNLMDFNVLDPVPSDDNGDNKVCQLA